jgi:hypothetical protein
MASHESILPQHFSKALDKVRAEEVRRLKAEGKDPVLTKSRWCFLKRKENHTPRLSPGAPTGPAETPYPQAPLGDDMKDIYRIVL